MSKWKMPEIEMSEAVQHLTTDGKKEWELAASRALIQKLSEECESLFDQVQMLVATEGYAADEHESLSDGE